MDIDRRLLIITQSETSDEAVRRLETSMEKLQRLELSSGYVELLKEAEQLRYGFKTCGIKPVTKGFGVQQESFVRNRLRTTRRIETIRTLTRNRAITERSSACCRGRGPSSHRLYGEARVCIETTIEEILRWTAPEDPRLYEMAHPRLTYHRPTSISVETGRRASDRPANSVQNPLFRLIDPF